MKTKLKTSLGLNPEMTPSNTFGLPDEILMALEATGLSENPELDDLEIQMVVTRAQRFILRRSFGKWLPKGADTIIETTRKEMVQHALERGYPLTPDDQIACTVWNAQRVKELEAWKEEQKAVRRANQWYLKEETAKKQVGDRKQWVDARVFELPPLVQSDGKGMKHVEARYAVRLPDGRYFDLGMTQGEFRPIMSDGPDIALQRIAKRAGLDMRGGAHTILQALTGYSDILPSYMAVWTRNQWLVIVGWHKDPKLTASNYYLDGTQLNRAGDPEDRLTLSELDYHLLKGSAETEVWDITEEVVTDYMNEDEELVMEGFMRDENEEAVPFDNGLMVAAADVLGLSHEFRDGSAVWNHPDLYRALCVVLNDRRRECRQHRTQIRALKKLNGDLFHRMYGASESLKAELKAEMADHFREISRLRSRISRLHISFRDQLADLEGQAVLVHDSPAQYWVRNEAPGFGRMKGYMDHAPLMEPCRTTPAMSLSPANEVQVTSRTFHVEQLGEHRVSEMHRVKRSTMAVVGFDLSAGTVVKKAIPAAPQAPLSASNASPRLRETLRGIIRAELETGTLEQEVADTFAAALNEALRATR